MPFVRHDTSVCEAPNTPADASAQPSRLGVKNWIALSESSSTCWADIEYVGALPVAATFDDCTIWFIRLRTVPDRTWSAAE
nr:hypothetical protein [Actinomadura sp. CNU-125]